MTGNDSELPPEPPLDFGVSDEPTTEVEVVCAAQSAASELRRVHLAFLLDVSASMGNNEARFNAKWLPIVAAAEAFFAEEDAAAISASLTFYPAGNNNTRCADDTYLAPHVPATNLPSVTFSTAIQGLGRTPTAQWATATPVLHAFNGTVASLPTTEDGSDLLTAVVLVTDGVPQGCSAAANDVAAVAAAVRASGVRTFVIGVSNPPGLGNGDNLDNLHLIAEAGGTEAAFIVQTGDPATTQAEFKAVIDGIRGVSVSCNMEIPLPPAGTEFVPEKVNVLYGSSDQPEISLSYDPECADINGWRYDDPAAPSSIVLCEAACLTAQRDASARLNVEFGCERRGTPR